MSLELNFTNKTIIVDKNEDYIEGCIFFKNIFSCEESESKLTIKIGFDSSIFEKYIKKTCIEHFRDYFNYSDEKLEEIFHQLGYFGAEKQIKCFKDIVKMVIRNRFMDRESVMDLFEFLEIKSEDYHMQSYSLLVNKNMTDKFVNKYFDRFRESSLRILSVNEFLSDLTIIRIIRKYPNIDIYPRNEVIYNEIIKHRKIQDNNWFRAGMDNFSEDFIEAHMEYVDMSRLFHKKHLDNSFFIKHHKRINWESINENSSRIFDYNFLLNYIEEKYWDRNKHSFIVLVCNNINEFGSITNENFDKRINEHMINVYNENKYKISFFISSESFVRKNINDIPFTTLYLLQPNIYEKIIEEQYENKRMDGKHWKLVSQKLNLSKEFIIKHFDKLHLQTICECNDAGDDFFIEYLEKFMEDGKVNPLDFCQNKHLTGKFFKKLLPTIIYDEKAWGMLCLCKNLTPSFFEEIMNHDDYKNMINWYNLSMNSGMDEDFFRKYKDNVTSVNILNSSFRYKKDIDYSKYYLGKYLN
jgi:hypothetical protein